MVFIDEASFRKMIREEVKESLKEVAGERPAAVAKASGELDLADLTTAGYESQLSANTIRDWIRKGHLPGYGKGKGLRVSRSELQAYLKARAKKSGGDSSDAELAARADRVLRKGR